MRRLSVEEVKKIHTTLISETGGIDGVRDEGLLESALHSPFQTFDNVDIYSTLEEKAARLCYSLVNNHAFIDGNKRIGILAMLVFLEMNGIILDCNDDELIKLGLGIADGSIDNTMLLDWIRSHQK